jgi:bla regulator protein BlaR1
MALPQSLIEIVNVVGAVLLHFLWQGAFIGGVYAAARPFFPTMSARYRLGLAALIALALCPVVTLVYLWPEPGVQSAAALPAIGATVLAVADRAAAGWHLQAVLPWLVGAWFVCVAVLATRSFWQWRRLLRIVREASAPSPEWNVRLTRLRERFGLRRPVRLLCSARAVTPMLIGWIRPVVLLPASMMSGFTPAQIELIIAHELGHICRWDYVANLFQVLIETVLFYHPVVHWISHDVRNARESCCDDLVLHLADGNPLAYARTLADLEELRHDEGLLTPALGASGGVLLARIRHIVGVNDGQERTQRTHFWPAVLVAVALALFVWRQHSTPTLPQSQALTATLASAPAQALAMVSGNSQLAKAPSMAPAPAPVSVPREVAVPTQQTETAAPVVAEKVNIDRPRVSVASSRNIDGVRDLIAVASMTASPLLFAEPVANDAVPASAAATIPLSPLHIVQPIYPPQAMATGVEGKVQLEFSVNAEGLVSDIHTVTASPPNVFDAAAQTALRGWRFEPGTTGRHRQNFAFTLHNNGNEKCQQPTGTMICRRPSE